MIRPDNLQIFARVAELASFTKAADSLGLPKASVSSAIQQLESQLSTQLLHRTTRKVQMTQDGQVFYERCKDMLADMDELEGLFQQDSTGLTGRLRIDMPNKMGRDLIIPNLPAFLQQHPQLALEISSTDRRVDVIREGFDCVIRAGRLNDSSLIARHLGGLTLINCASPEYLARYGTPQSPADLAQHQLVHYVTNLGAKPLGFEYVVQGELQFLEMPGAITVNNADAYTEACLAGLGIIQVPLVGARAYLKSGQMVQILEQYRAEPIPVSVIYPNRRNLSRRARVFIDWVSELIKNYLD
jgi:DNA-binding transcriptional LysR family regulator